MQTGSRWRRGGRGSGRIRRERAGDHGGDPRAERLDHRRDKPRRSRVQRPSRLPGATRKLLRREAMPPTRHLGHHGARDQRLFENAGLVVRRPPPPATSTVDDLNAAWRPLRLKRKLKSRRKWAGRRGLARRSRHGRRRATPQFLESNDHPAPATSARLDPRRLHCREALVPRPHIDPKGVWVGEHHELAASPASRSRTSERRRVAAYGRRSCARACNVDGPSRGGGNAASLLHCQMDDAFGDHFPRKPTARSGSERQPAQLLPALQLRSPPFFI